MTQPVQRPSAADLARWFPVVEVWPEVTNGRRWCGTCLASMKTVRIEPSSVHPGFFDYSVTDLSSGNIDATLRPVAEHAVRSFLEAAGIRPTLFAWLAQGDAA